MASEETESLGTCDSQVELSMLASGMAKQHESYQDALQELIDNSVSSVVKSESYFDDPSEQINIVISLQRSKDSLRTTVVDNGPGIGTEALEEKIFKTGNKTESDGILNNVGWGLKASLAWFEETLQTESLGCADNWFELVTKRDDGEVKKVSGPITGELPIEVGTTTDWKRGTTVGNHKLTDGNSGTRVHISSSWTRFSEDVWPSAAHLSVKAQALREYLGVRYRRVLSAHPDSSLCIDYTDTVKDESGSLEVIPIHPQYKSADADPPEEKSTDSFSLEMADGAVFDIEYERGTIDYEAMSAEVAEQDPELLTSSGRFRTRYRPSQSRQGVDIYANGRVLMTSVFTELFDLTRNNQYNYFGGTIKISPQSSDTEVPTDNKKTRIDSNSELWQCLRDRLAQDPYLPSGKNYDQTDSAEGADVAAETLPQGGELRDEMLFSGDAAALPIDEDDVDGHIYEDLIHGDSRYLKKYLDTAMGDDVTGKIDLAITSPPYFDLKDYDVKRSNQIGQDESYQEYLTKLETVLTQAYDVISEEGSLWIVINNFRTDRQMVDLPGDIIELCQSLSVQEHCPNCSTDELRVPLMQTGPTTVSSCVNCEYTPAEDREAWILKDIIVWDKHHALPFAQNGQFRNVFEHILCFTKSDEFEFETDEVRITDPGEFQDWWVEYPERYNPRGMIPRNIWEFITPSQGKFSTFEALDHPAPFPPRLVKRIIELTSEEGDTVLDPFAGSGMVPATADALNRVGIGIEPSTKFCELYPELKSEVNSSFDTGTEENTRSNQDGLAEMIMSLRMVKQAKEILRMYQSSETGITVQDIEIHTVFQICQELTLNAESRSSHAASELLFVVDEGTEQRRIRDLEHSFVEIVNEQPLSQYDITSTVRVLSNEDLCEYFQRKTDSESLVLSTYRNGKFYQKDSNRKFEAWRRDALETNTWQRNRESETYPPILSNVDVSVQNPRQMSESFSEDGHAEISVRPVDMSG